MIKKEIVLQHWSRDQMVAFLEGRGYQCYDRESAEELAEAVAGDLNTEGEIFDPYLLAQRTGKQ